MMPAHVAAQTAETHDFDIDLMEEGLTTSDVEIVFSETGGQISIAHLARQPFLQSDKEKEHVTRKYC